MHLFDPQQCTCLTLQENALLSTWKYLNEGLDLNNWYNIWKRQVCFQYIIYFNVIHSWYKAKAAPPYPQATGIVMITGPFLHVPMLFYGERLFKMMSGYLSLLEKRAVTAQIIPWNVKLASQEGTYIFTKMYFSVKKASLTYTSFFFFYQSWPTAGRYLSVLTLCPLL